MDIESAKKKVQQFIDYATNEDIPVSKWVRLLVNSYLSDLEKAKTYPDFPYYFDEAAALHNFSVFCTLQFCEGRWRGKPFEFTAWQAFSNWNIYGWKRKDNGWRRYFKVYIKVPRKNGKTEYLAAIGIYGHRFDHYEKDAQVFWFATKKEQAVIGFRKQKQMTTLLAEKSPRFRTMVKVLQYRISDRDGMGFAGYLGKDSKSEDGHNPFYGICDEYHAHPTNDMVDVVESGMGARISPLTWIITTAGTNADGVCAQFETTCKQILSGILPNPGIFPLICDLDEDDDWEDPESWKKVNISLGETISIDYLKKEYEKAKTEGVSAIANFKTKNLNIWLKAHSTWIKDSSWSALKADYSENDLAGVVCLGGLDLASVSDLCALSYYFPPTKENELGRWLFRAWCPEDTAYHRAKNDGVPYLEWAESGCLTLTPGNVTDYNFIKKQIRDDYQKFKIHSIAYDRYNASQLVIDLQDDGFRMEPFGQGFVSMSAPTKEFERSTLSAAFEHDGNRLFRWALSNVSIRHDPAGNIKVDKEKSADKIDPVVAAIMALGQYAEYKNEVDSVGQSLLVYI